MTYENRCVSNMEKGIERVFKQRCTDVSPSITSVSATHLNSLMSQEHRLCRVDKFLFCYPNMRKYPCGQQHESGRYNTFTLNRSSFHCITYIEIHQINFVFMLYMFITTLCSCSIRMVQPK